MLKFAKIIQHRKISMNYDLKRSHHREKSKDKQETKTKVYLRAFTNKINKVVYYYKICDISTILR